MPSSPVCAFAFRLLRVRVVLRLLHVRVVLRLLHIKVDLVEAVISSGLPLLSRVHTRLLGVPALLSRRFPDQLLTLNIAVDLAVVQIRARVTRFVVAAVSGIDDRTKNLIGLVHERVGHAEITEHLRQREVLGRDKNGGDDAGPPWVVSAVVVFSAAVTGSAVNIGGP